MGHAIIGHKYDNQWHIYVANDPMRASRLLSIQMLLETRGQMSARDLADSLGTSVRTLHRDIDQLTLAGVPIYAERGRNGGFRLLPGWKAILTGLTPAEMQAVFLSGLGAPAAQLGLSHSIQSAELKLMSAMPEHWRSEAKRFQDRIHLDPTDWYRESDSPSNLASVADAVWRGKKLAITYESWQANVKRALSPLGLVLKATAWYLVALSQGQLRTYRVSNILQAEILEETFSRPKNFALAKYWKQSVERFEAEIYVGFADVLATERGLKWLRQESAAMAKGVAESSTPVTDGRVRVHIPVEQEQSAAVQLMRFSPDVEVIKPASLRTAVRKRLEAAVKQYLT